jgi:STE24 endopeptidase
MSEDSLRSTPGLRTAIACLVLAFGTVFVLNVFGSSPASVERAQRYGFSLAEIERALRYSYEGKLIIWCGFGLQLALLTALVCTSWSRRLTDWFDRLTGRRWLLTLLLVAGTCFLVNELVSLPVGLAGLEHARAWNMTERGVGAWLVDRAKAFAVTAVSGTVVLLGLYGLMRLFPRFWWLLATGAGTALGVLVAWLMPVVLFPLFYTFEPLEDPYLRQRVQVLAEKAHVPTQEVFVMNGSSRSRHTNAFFAGFGSTRRIVLFDTLLKSHSGVQPESVASTVGLLANGPAGGPWLAASQLAAAHKTGDDEVESILGHELGHWQHDHIVKGIALASLGSLLGLWLLARILRWAVNRQPFCLHSPTDPAGLPLIFLLMLLGNWLAMPVQNAVSRSFERQADQAALELAGRPDAFISGEKRLARDNLTNVAPTPFNVWMFSTHPPTVERIEMAEQWKKQTR